MNPSMLFSVVACATGALVVTLVYALRRAKRELALQEAEALLRREFDETLKRGVERETS